MATLAGQAHATGTPHTGALALPASDHMLLSLADVSWLMLERKEPSILIFKWRCPDVKELMFIKCSVPQRQKWLGDKVWSGLPQICLQESVTVPWAGRRPLWSAAPQAMNAHIFFGFDNTNTKNPRS